MFKRLGQVALVIFFLVMIGACVLVALGQYGLGIIG